MLLLPLLPPVWELDGLAPDAVEASDNELAEGDGPEDMVVVRE